jgi:hypothetical protein
MNELELKYVQSAGELGGKYLEHIGKYNLMELTKEQWLGFCFSICRDYHREMKAAELSLLPGQVPY